MLWYGNRGAEREGNGIQMGSGRVRGDAVDVHVGGRIRLKRMSAGISRDRLAEIGDVTAAEVEAIERGDYRAPNAFLAAAADGLGVDISDFFDDFDAAFPDVPSTRPDDGSIPTLDEVRRVLNAFVRVRSPSFREGLARQAEAAAELA